MTTECYFSYERFEMKTSELHYRITNQEWRQMKRELTYALKCLNTDRQFWDEAYRQSQESKERAIVPAAARPVEKAFVDMNPQEQAAYKATIAQNRPRSGGDPAFTKAFDIIAQAALNPTP